MNFVITFPFTFVFIDNEKLLLHFFSKMQLPADDLSGADTTSFSRSRHSLAKAVHLLNKLAVTLSELEAQDPTHQYTEAANKET